MFLFILVCYVCCDSGVKEGVSGCGMGVGEAVADINLLGNPARFLHRTY